MRPNPGGYQPTALLVLGSLSKNVEETQFQVCYNPNLITMATIKLRKPLKPTKITKANHIEIYSFLGTLSQKNREHMPEKKICTKCLQQLQS